MLCVLQVGAETVSSWDPGLLSPASLPTVRLGLTESQQQHSRISSLRRSAALSDPIHSAPHGILPRTVYRLLQHKYRSNLPLLILIDSFKVSDSSDNCGLCLGSACVCEQKQSQSQLAERASLQSPCVGEGFVLRRLRVTANFF